MKREFIIFCDVQASLLSKKNLVVLISASISTLYDFLLDTAYAVPPYQIRWKYGYFGVLSRPTPTLV